MRKLGLFSVILLFLSTSAPAITIKDLKSGMTAADLVNILGGIGATITNAKVTGANTAIGSFAGAAADGLGIDSGVILSTGNVNAAVGPNDTQSETTVNGTPGDVSLNNLVKPFKTNDAVILEFDVTTVSPTFAIRYVFASEEYKEYVNSPFNDVFAFFVDGANIAFVPGTGEPVAVNTINQLKNTAFYRDNPPGSGTINSQFDGMTTVLTAVASVTPGESHHIKIAIADTSDSLLDAAVYLVAGGITGTLLSAAVVAVPSNLVLFNGQSADVQLTVFGTTDPKAIQLSASGLPEDSTVSLTPVVSDGSTLTSKMTVNIGPGTPPGDYFITIRSVLAEAAEGITIVPVTVICDPPVLQAINNPKSQSVKRGSTVTLSVKPESAGPFTYQWYSGHAGFTSTPIANSNSPNFTTPAINSTQEFWVRISNACGTIDSQTATITPTQ